MRAGTFETGVQSAENYGRLFEQAYGRGYKGRSPGFSEDYEDSKKDIVANSFRLRAAQEEAKAHQYAAAVDYLKTIEAQRIESQGGIQEQKIKGSFDLAGNKIEGQYGLAKQQLADANAKERTIIDNEYDNVREHAKIKDNQYRAQLQEQGLNQRALLDNEMKRVLKGMDVESSLRNTIVGKQYDHMTAMAREQLISHDNKLRLGKELYDNPETQAYYAKYQEALQKGDLDLAAKIYTVGQLYSPTVRQNERQDKIAKERLDNEYRNNQLLLQQNNKDREFQLKFRKEARDSVTSSAANYVSLQKLMQKLDEDWNTKVNDPMLKPEQKQALMNDGRFIGPSIQAIQKMAFAQSDEDMERARQELTQYISQVSPESRNYIQQRAKIGSLLSNAEAVLYQQYGIHAPQDPDLMKDVEEEEPSRIAEGLKGVVGFVHGAFTAPAQAILDYYANDYYNTEPQNVDIVAGQLLRTNLRGQGFRGKLLEQEVNKRFQGMETKDKIKYIRDNVSMLEKMKAVVDSKAQSNPAANFDTETNRDYMMGLLALAGGIGLGKGASMLAKGALARGVTLPSGQALLSKLAAKFGQREAQVLARPSGFTPWVQGVNSGMPGRVGEFAAPEIPLLDAGKFPSSYPGYGMGSKPFPTQAPSIPVTGPRVFSPPTDAAPFPMKAGAYQQQSLAGQVLNRQGSNPIFQNAAGTYTNTTPSFVEAPSKVWPGPKPSYLPDTIHKVNTGLKVPPKQAKFTLNELKENPQVAYEIPDVQEGIKAGMQPDEAVAQWTTKMLQNVG